MRAELIRGHLELLVLSVISSDATHGYAIAEEIRRRSGGEIELREGSLYPALYRLENEGFLASDWREVSGRRRRVYQLTRAGRKALEGRAREWSVFSATVSRVIRGAPWADPA